MELPDEDELDEELKAKAKRLASPLWQPKAATEPKEPADHQPAVEQRKTNSPSSIEARFDKQEAQIARILEIVSSPEPHKDSIERWAASLATSTPTDNNRGTYAMRLSETTHRALIRAMEHRGYRTIADTLDEALRIAIPLQMRLPGNPTTWKRPGRKKVEKPTKSSKPRAKS